MYIIFLYLYTYTCMCMFVIYAHNLADLSFSLSLVIPYICTSPKSRQKEKNLYNIYIYTRKMKGIDLCYINVKTNPPEKYKERKRHTCIYI